MHRAAALPGALSFLFVLSACLFPAACAGPQRAAPERRTIDVVEPVGPFSGGVVAGDTLYASGQIGTIPGTKTLASGGIGPETRQALENLLAVLGRAGFASRDVTFVTVYLADMDEYGAMNAVYREFFTDQWPARACVAVKSLVLGARTEIACVAVKSP